jgi:6-phospho-3-hexuloisomerase
MQSIKPLIDTVCEEIRQCLGAISSQSLVEATSEISKATCVFLIGAGRSGLCIRGCAMRLMHMGKTVHVVGDVTTPGIDKGDLLIVGSGSGTTASLVAASQKAKQLGARILLITINPDSLIGRLADTVVRIPAPSPKAVEAGATIRSIQPMGSLFEQCLFLVLDILVMLQMREHCVSSENMFARHANLE